MAGIPAGSGARFRVLLSRVGHPLPTAHKPFRVPLSWLESPGLLLAIDSEAV